MEQGETYSKPSFTVFSNNFVLVTHPVPVPFPESGRVVNTDSIDLLDLEPSALELVNEESERSGGIGTGENVFVHE